MEHTTEYTIEAKKEIAAQNRKFSPDWTDLKVIIGENDYKIDVCFKDEHTEFDLKMEAHCIITWAIRQRIISEFNALVHPFNRAQQKPDEVSNVFHAAQRACIHTRLYSQPKPKIPSKDLVDYKETLRDKLENIGMADDEINAILA